MRKFKVPPELFALFLSNQTLLQILEQLPRTDLIEEATELLMCQAEILENKIAGARTDNCDLEQFIDHCIEIFDSYEQKNPLQHYDN